MINAVIGGVLVVWWIVLVRRGNDIVDLLVVGGLVAFLVACTAAKYPRQAFDAATAALVWGGAFGVARRALADPEQRLLCLRLLALCGVVLGAVFLFAWGRVWLDWLGLAGGVPPLDLTLPAHIYRHYYVVAMLLAALAPACAYLLRDRVLRYPAALAVTITVTLAVLSGSRTVWLAAVIAVLAAVVLFGPPRRPLVAIAAVVAGIGIVALASGLLPPVVERLVASGTVGYRLDIWRSAAQIWSEHPLTGIGPGSISIGLTLTDLLSHYSFNNRHADSAIIQLAAEGGIVGIAGGALATAGVLFGRRRSLPGARMALLGLILLAGMSLTNNPTDSPNLVAIIVCYAALVAPYEPRERRQVDQSSTRQSFSAGAAWVAAGVVGLAVALVNLAAMSHASGRSSAVAGSWTDAARQLAVATALDPAMALYHRERGLVLMEIGSDPPAALRELEFAVQLNPADASALRAVAVQRVATEEGEGANEAARRAAEVRPLFAENWITLALVSDGEEARAALVEALVLAPWLPGSSAWPEHVADQAGLLAALDEAAALAGTRPAPRDPISLVWLDAFTSAPIAVPDAGPLRALKLVLTCDLAGADMEFAAMRGDWVDTTAGIVGRVMLARLTSDPAADELIQTAALQQPDLGAAARGFASTYSLLTDPVADAQLYRRLGIGPASPGPAVPRTPDALGEWMTAPRESAARVAPTSALAGCR
jgi:O-antigen ligase